MIIFDLDGTAIDTLGANRVTPRLRAAIDALRGHYFLCAATGRPWDFAQPILQDLQLRDPCVISGGTQLCDPQTGEILWQQSLEPADVAQIASILSNYDDYRLVYNNFSEHDYRHGGIAPSQLPATETVFFINFAHIPPAVADELLPQLQRLPNVSALLGVPADSRHFKEIHLTHKLATKEQAIHQLLARLGVAPRATTGIGDGYNDLHLFKSVHTKVAMGNAVPALKQAADVVIGPVSEDGLAGYLESLRQA